MFFKGSRYANVETAETIDSQRRKVLYKRVRYIADVPGGTTHAVKEYERLDHIAHVHYRDPEQFWRICDANRALWPPDLSSEPGRRVGIPPAEDPA